MNQIDQGFLQYLSQHGLEYKQGFYIAFGIFLLLVIVYAVRKIFASPAELGTPVVVKKTPQSIPPQPALKRQSFDVDDTVIEPPKTVAEVPKPTVPDVVEAPQVPVPKPQPVVASKTVSTPLPHIPQESILRRHYLTHIQYMIEVTTFPKPTESVLRRHYEQLVGGIFESCVEDAAELDKLVRRYDEYRRTVVS